MTYVYDVQLSALTTFPLPLLMAFASFLMLGMGIYQKYH